MSKLIQRYSEIEEIVGNPAKVRHFIRAGIICIYYNHKWQLLNSDGIRKTIDNEIQNIKLDDQFIEINFTDGTMRVMPNIVYIGSNVDKVKVCAELNDNLWGCVNNQSNIPRQLSRSVFYLCDGMDRTIFDAEQNEIIHTSRLIFNFSTSSPFDGVTVIMESQHVLRNATIIGNAIYIDGKDYYLTTSNSDDYENKYRIFEFRTPGYNKYNLLSDYKVPFHCTDDKTYFNFMYVPEILHHVYLIDGHYCSIRNKKVYELTPINVTKPTRTKSAN